MNCEALETLLKSGLPAELAKDLVAQFLQMRQDIASGTLGRSAPGKFVESLVQTMQYLETNKYEKQPKVDEYLKNVESRTSTLPDDLRICAARIARAMYTLRNKRNILHKGDVDPNEFDLCFLHAAAQWIMAELIRRICGTTMHQAGTLIAQVQAPTGALVEDFGGRRLVYGELTAKQEILVLLQSHYPSAIAVAGIVSSLNRRNPDAVKNAVRDLWRDKLIEGSAAQGYRLTGPGLREAIRIAQEAIT